MPDDRLLALTCALEDAVIRRDWPEVTALFEERGQLLETAPRLDSSKIEAILDADARLARRLQLERTTVMSTLRQSRKVSAARSLYAKLR